MRQAFLHGVAAAWASILRAPISHVVASLTVGATLWVAFTTASLAVGVRSLLASWGGRVELTLYLADDVTEEAGRRLAEEAAAKVAGSARWVAPEEALERLRAALGDEDGLLLDLPLQPLPASIELRPGVAAGVDELPHLARVLASLPGVEEVDWGRGWAERLAKLSRMAEGGLAVVLAALFSGSLLLVGGVVRFAVHARRDEIEVLELLGASDAFIRLPFLLEGMFAGAVGGGYAAAALLGFAAWEARLTAALPLPEEISVAAWAGGGAALGLVAAGALLGLFATVFALARELR